MRIAKPIPATQQADGVRLCVPASRRVVRAVAVVEQPAFRVCVLPRVANVKGYGVAVVVPVVGTVLALVKRFAAVVGGSSPKAEYPLPQDAPLCTGQPARRIQVIAVNA